MNSFGLNNRAQMGEGIMVVYRLLMVTVIAFIVFGVASISYEYYIDIRDAEAVVLARQTSDCLSSDGILDLDEIGEDNYGSILSYCGFPKSDRIYVEVNAFDSLGEKVVKLQEGDSGAMWIRDLFGKAVATGNAIIGGDASNVENIEKYNPGHFEFEHSVYILKDGVETSGSMKVEVLVNAED